MSGLPSSSLLLRTSKTRRTTKHSYLSTWRTKQNDRGVEEHRSLEKQVHAVGFPFSVAFNFVPTFLAPGKRAHAGSGKGEGPPADRARERGSRILSAHRQSLRLNFCKSGVCNKNANEHSTGFEKGTHSSTTVHKGKERICNLQPAQK